ncbi:ATP-binding protein [Microbacterium esteraromaticum]|uniref:ATP-binding protein n=1 Tax=Microbacterium esteraromaticum TaxID=57043 RepID=A0A7D8AAK8_9MICO|nr:ATP-binding protein [Microbacterium esteraromaticum]
MHRKRRSHVRAPLPHLPGQRRRDRAHRAGGGAPQDRRREPVPNRGARRPADPDAAPRGACEAEPPRRAGRGALRDGCPLRSARSVTLAATVPDVGGRWHDESMSLIASTADMVGRDAELELLDAALRRAAAGEAASVLVAGEAGIGKSRLLREFRGRMAESALVLTGWCLDYGSTPAPYAPLPSILRGALAALGADAAESAGPARTALRLLLPELGRARSTARRGRRVCARRSPTCSRRRRHGIRSSSSSKTCTGPTTPLCRPCRSCSAHSQAVASCSCSPAGSTRCAAEGPCAPSSSSQSGPGSSSGSLSSASTPCRCGRCSRLSAVRPTTPPSHD